MSRRPFDCCTVHSNSTNRLHTDTRGVQSQEQVPTHTLKWFLTSNLYDPGSVVQRVCFGLSVSRMRSVNTDAHQISGLTPVFCFYIFLHVCCFVSSTLSNLTSRYNLAIPLLLWQQGHCLWEKSFWKTQLWWKERLKSMTHCCKNKPKVTGWLHDFIVTTPTSLF